MANPKHFMTWTSTKIPGATKKWCKIEKARVPVEDKTWVL